MAVIADRRIALQEQHALRGNLQSELAEAHRRAPLPFRILLGAWAGGWSPGSGPQPFAVCDGG